MKREQNNICFFECISISNGYVYICDIVFAAEYSFQVVFKIARLSIFYNNYRILSSQTVFCQCSLLVRLPTS
jgi:hypothetical protein